jgi:hypothetical protein
MKEMPAMTHEPQVDFDLDLDPDIDRIYDEFGALLTEREAADLLGTQVRTLQTWRHSGTGPPYIKLGEAHNAPVRYPAAKLRRFLQQHTIRTAGAVPMLSGMAEATEAGFDRASRRQAFRRSTTAPDRPAAPPAPAPQDGLASLRTVKRLAEELAPSGLTEASIRWAIFHEKSNGLKESGAVVRPPGSRRVFIDRDKYEQWLRSAGVGRK